MIVGPKRFRMKELFALSLISIFTVMRLAYPLHSFQLKPIIQAPIHSRTSWTKNKHPFIAHHFFKNHIQTQSATVHLSIFSSLNPEGQENTLGESYPNNTILSNTTNTNSQKQKPSTSSSSPILNDSFSSISDTNSGKSRGDKLPLEGRKMELSWCTREEGCHVETTIRETVEGPNNHISFQGPATGQVTYNWIKEESQTDVSCTSNEDESNDPQSKKNPTVLLLVKKDDEDLMIVAADAVRSLTSKDSNIDVLLFPECAAKLKYHHGVDDDHHIQLFESEDILGFGSDICSLDVDNLETECQDVNPDLICTLGGDGLLMYASSLFPGPAPPILCIAGGSLGFLTPFSRDEMVEAIQHALGLIESDEMTEKNLSPLTIKKLNLVDTYNPDSTNMAKKKFSFSQYGICLSMRMRLDCRVVNREGIVRARYNVLNEVVIDRGSSPFLSNLECFCDNVHLTTVQADGIIFSTPTGSTAYSMAAGGSVVHPAVPAILVTPICPHVLSFRSMIFPDHVVLRCYVPDDARSGACVAFDGKHRRELNKGDSVQIQMCVHPVPTINKMDHSSDWLDSLKRNFHFNARPVQKPF